MRKILLFAALALTCGESALANENLIKIPLTRQATDYTCGAAAMQSMLGYYGEDLNESELAKILKTNDQEGTDYNEIVALAKEKGYSVNVFKDMTLKDLKKQLDKKTPVLCLIQAWATKKTDYKTDWNDGHYVVAIGYDKNKIYFMDPSTLGNYTYIDQKGFLKRWHDKNSKETLNHFGLTIKKKKTAYKQEEIKFMP
ncbi:MAG: C39 family peptidase [Candidatus Melainabacteria bacterium]|nr:C39 family peptidase [Candidatus Melainabacteria bacterium]